MASKFRGGDLVWVQQSNVASGRAFVRGCVVDEPGAVALDDVLVKLEESPGAVSSATRRYACGELRHRFPGGDETSFADCTSLPHLNDACILENLRRRLKSDQIYTYTGSVLLAVNPYRELQGLYGTEQCERYRGKYRGSLPPHPYAIADTAYRQLCRERVNQAVLISGESGAGKTESAKIVMKYLAHASGVSSGYAADMQRRVLQAQPILESFGNAQTVRNRNSSRFGKYNKVFFDGQGALVDAGITTYLLESSRVVAHARGERTYHVLYEMLGGISDKLRTDFQLERGRRYRLLGEAEINISEQDVSNYGRLREALVAIGNEEHAIDSVLEVLAGLIHLGNVGVEDPDNAASFMQQPPAEGESEGAVMVDEESVLSAARLLGMNRDELVGVLQYKQVTTRKRDERAKEVLEESTKVPRRPEQFRHTLDSLIKSIYKRLFEFVVNCINSSFRELRPDIDAPLSRHRTSTISSVSSEPESRPESWRHIGILDIYGFERLETNSFEQLCINLANERLQNYFVEKMLSEEQGIYKQEGLPFTELNLPDCSPVVDSITQVFKTLDDFSQRLLSKVGNTDDEHFCKQLIADATAHGRQKVLKDRRPPRTRHRMSTSPGGPGGGIAKSQGFSITHYAGSVDYTAIGWPDKNVDKLPPECEALLSQSSNEHVIILAETDKASQRATNKSISKKYTQDLEALLKTLRESELHCIRCFKPSQAQRAGDFDERFVLDQIVQCGTIELVKMMHDGYPYRCVFAEVVERFKELLPDKFKRYGARTFLEALLLAYDVPRTDWDVGTTKLFLKAGQLQKLEELRFLSVKPDQERLDEIVRGIIRKRWKRATCAISLCSYLPKILAKKRAARCRAKLYRASLLGAKLKGRLVAARGRLQIRRDQAARLERRREHDEWFRQKLARLTRLAIVFRRQAAAARARVRIRRLQEHDERFRMHLVRLTRLAIRLRRWAKRGRERVLEAAKAEREFILQLAREATKCAERRRLKEEREAAERERIAREAAEAAERKRLEEERQRLEAEAAAERERIAREEAEAEQRRLEAEAAEKERIAREAAEAAEKRRLEEEAAEKERIAREAAEAEAERRRFAAEAAERERIAREAAEAKRRKLEEEARERAEAAERRRLEEEAAEKERIAREMAEAAERRRLEEEEAAAERRRREEKLKELEDQEKQRREQANKDIEEMAALAELQAAVDGGSGGAPGTGELRKHANLVRGGSASARSLLSPEASEALRKDCKSLGVSLLDDDTLGLAQDILRQRIYWEMQRQALVDELFPETAGLDEWRCTPARA